MEVKEPRKMRFCCVASSILGFWYNVNVPNLLVSVLISFIYFLVVLQLNGINGCQW